MRLRLIILLGAIVLLLQSGAIWATPTQDEVFKSISDNMSTADNGASEKGILAVGAVVVGLVILLAVLGKRGRKSAIPKAFNHPGKLTRELMKKVPLRKSELKTLKTLAEVKQDGHSVEHPLVLALCPSLLAKAAGKKGVKVDKKAVASLMRRLQMQGK